MHIQDSVQVYMCIYLYHLEFVLQPYFAYHLFLAADHKNRQAHGDEASFTWILLFFCVDLFLNLSKYTVLCPVVCEQNFVNLPHMYLG